MRCIPLYVCSHSLSVSVTFFSLSHPPFLPLSCPLSLTSTFTHQAASETAPAPTRGPNAAGDEVEEASGGDGGGGGGGGAAAPVSLADLMPKVDVSGQIKPDLIKDLGDKNWKVRGEALQRVSCCMGKP